MRYLKLVSGENMLTSDNELANRQRKVTSNFFQYHELAIKVAPIKDVIIEMFELLAKRPSLKNLRLMDEIQIVSGETIGRLFFSEVTHTRIIKATGRCIQTELTYLVNEVAIEGRKPLCIFFGPEIIKRGLNSTHRKLWERVTEVRKLISDLIQERRDSGERKKDMLDILLESQKNPDPNLRYSDEDIINSYLSFMVAGTDTTGHTVSAAIYEMLLNPETMEDVKKEILEKYDRDNVDLEMLKKLELTTGALKEALRLHTPVPAPFPQLSQVDHKLGEYKIKKGTLVRPEFCYNMYHEKFFPEPHKFNPQRWVNDDPKDAFAFTPFSMGSRICIGQHLAYLTAKMIVAEFLLRFDVKLSDPNYNPKWIFNLLLAPYPTPEVDLTVRRLK